MAGEKKIEGVLRPAALNVKDIPPLPEQNMAAYIYVKFKLRIRTSLFRRLKKVTHSKFFLF